MKISSYCIADLRKLLEYPAFWDQEILPISKHRLVSHINNPRANEDDIVLLTAHEDGNVEAYIGILPDLCFTSDGETQKFGWFSTWWVNPLSPNKGIGAILMLRALKLYGGNIAAKGFTKEAEQVYVASKKFSSVKKHFGKRFVYRFSSNLVKQKYPKLDKFEPVMAFLFGGLNLFINFRQKIYSIKNYRGIKAQLEYISDIDIETETFIEKYKIDEATQRGKNEIDWVRHYPWVLNAPLMDESDTRFDFLSIAKNRYEHFNIKVFDQAHNLIGFLMLCIVDDQIRIPYYYCEENELDLLCRIILRHVIDYKISMLTIFDERLVDAVDRLSPHLFKMDYQKEIIATASLKPLFDDRVFQDGDGDWIFS